MADLQITAGDNFFRVFNQGFVSMAEQMENEIRQYFREQVALGRDPLDVLKSLEESRKGDLGLIRKITGGVEAKLDLGSNTLFQIASNEPLKGKAELFVWTLDPSAEHCDSCLAQSKMGPRPWDEIPYPGSQPQAGKTNCTTYCKCTLEPEVPIVA